MTWMACIPLMQEQLTVCEVWNWLQEKRFARNVPKAEVGGCPADGQGWPECRKCRTQFSVRVLFADQKVPIASLWLGIRSKALISKAFI